MSSLRLVFLDVGQGDTTIVYDSGSREAVIVDCTDYTSVIDFLLSENIKRIRAVILTHPHSDHYSGVTQLIDNCEPSGITWNAWILRWHRGVEKHPDLLRDPDGHSDMSGEANAADNGKKRAISTFQNLRYYAQIPEIKKKILGPFEVQKDGSILDSIEFIYPREKHFPVFETSNLNNLIQ